MSERNFFEMLKQAQEENNSRVCVGLDSDILKIPSVVSSNLKEIFGKAGDAVAGMAEDAIDLDAASIQEFTKDIVKATKDHACAFKPNLAFYLSVRNGIHVLDVIVDYIHNNTRLPVILDAKLGDIGNTNKAYLRGYFESDRPMTDMVFTQIGADAVTVQPYLGSQSLEPVLERENKGIIVLCRTSNPGAEQFQDLKVGDENIPLYQKVADTVAKEWNYNNNCGLVVGATYPKEAAMIRDIVGNEMFILYPGLGAQEGSVQEAVNANKRGLCVYNSSRSIDFAYTKTDEFTAEEYAAAATHAAEGMRVQINELW